MAALVKVLSEVAQATDSNPWVLPSAGWSLVLIGGRFYAIFGSLSGADLYNYPTTWSGATADARKRALVQATRWLNRVEWTGLPIGPLAWPRTGASSDGAALPDNVVPSRVREATYELALSLLQDPGVEAAPAVSSLSAGSVSVSFRQSSRPGRFPAVVTEMIRPLLPVGSTPAGSHVTGIDEEITSAFEDEDLLGLSEPLA